MWPQFMRPSSYISWYVVQGSGGGQVIEFESRWSLQFLFRKLFEKNENKPKEAGDGRLKKNSLSWAPQWPIDNTNNLVFWSRFWIS